MALHFPVGDLRAAPGFGAGSIQEVVPFGPDPAGTATASDRLVLAFPGPPADLVAPFDAVARLVPAPSDLPGSPSVVDLQPIVTGSAGVALADGLDDLSDGSLAGRAGLLPRVRLHGVDPGLVGLVEAALTPVITAQVTSTNPAEASARIDRFRAGAFGVVVAGGTTIASAVAGVGIEIATSDGVAVDPVAYYAHYLALGAADAQLVDRDWCETVVARLTRRSLVQVVDAHGQPWAESVRVLDGAGTTSDVDLSGVAGMLIVANFPSAGPTELLVASIELTEPGAEAGGQSASRYLLTSEWPAEAHTALGPIALGVPSRPTMRRFVVTDLRRWFASQHVTEPGFVLPRYTLDNHVIPLVDGLNAFRLALHDLTEANAPGGFYYLTAWGLDSYVPLDGSNPETALRTLLGNVAAQPGGHVRVLAWDEFQTDSAELQATVLAAYGLAGMLLTTGAAVVPPAALIVGFVLLAGNAIWAAGAVNPIIDAIVAKLVSDNEARLAELEEVGAETILDGKVRETRSDGMPRLYDFVGSHHQKLSVISGPAGMVAYCGGIDMRTNRLADQRHLEASPYHDLHCRVAGPAAFDFARTFRDRWDDQADPAHLSADDGDLVAPAPAGSTHVVQVARTYPNGLTLTGGAYPFAPVGDRTIRATLYTALAQARRYIYVEDQYLTPPDDLAALLAQQLAAEPDLRLVMVIPRGGDQPENTSRRATFIGNLLRDYRPERVITLFPTRLAFAHDRERHGPVVTRLREPITAAGLELQVEDATGYTESGTVLIGTEEIAYASRDLAANKLVVDPSGRGHNNTEADAHLDGARVALVAYRDIFVHPKLWIIDDVFVSLGSANVNNRGMNHDSEANVFVVDGRSDRGARRFAKQLRVDLWAEHLGLGESAAARMLLDDPEVALDMLIRRPGPAGNRLRRYWQTWTEDHKTESWRSLLAPGLYWDAYQVLGQPLLGDALWTTYVDPDGSAPLT